MIIKSNIIIIEEEEKRICEQCNNEEIVSHRTPSCKICKSWVNTCHHCYLRIDEINEGIYCYIDNKTKHKYHFCEICGKKVENAEMLQKEQKKLEKVI